VPVGDGDGVGLGVGEGLAVGTGVGDRVGDGVGGADPEQARTVQTTSSIVIPRLALARDMAASFP
jgi:hypothetical protein